MLSDRSAGRRLAIRGLIVLSLLTLAFQAVYVFLPTADVIRPDGYDSKAHFQYYDWVEQHPHAPWGFRRAYTWVHFPTFYQWNSFVAETVCQFVGATCAQLGLKVAWFLQAILRVLTLTILFALFRRLFRSWYVTIAALALCATAQRVFFLTCIWNQDEYVFFFATILMYVTIASIQDGLTVPRLLLAALAAAFGFKFKLAIMLPVSAMLFTIVLLPRRRAAVAYKVVAVALTAVAIVAVNWTLFASAQDGRPRLTWMSTSAHYTMGHRNSEDIVGAYLTLNPGPIFFPEPVYVRASPTDWTSLNSATTTTFLSLFELYDHFQGPPRTWLNLLCVWTGTPLLGLVLWRAGRTLLALRSPATIALDELYFTVLLGGTMFSMISFSLALPFGWTTHPEYLVTVYPAATVLLFRQLLSMRHRRAGRWFVGLVGVHFVLNFALLAHTAAYKISVNL